MRPPNRLEYERKYRRSDKGLNNRLMREYGITLKEYQKMFSDQAGKCSICKKEEQVKDVTSGKPRRLAVDHCHRTGKVRALLCVKCNKGMGFFNEDASLLEAASNYLKNQNAS